MKEFLHSVAGVALCRGDNKGIPRMPCVICTARLRKRLPAPGSPPHCWFSGTHPHPGAINAGSLLCRGGSGADLLWMVSSQRATPLSQQGQNQLPPRSHSMISSAHFTRPPVQTWALPGVQQHGDKVRLLFTSDPCRTQRHAAHCAGDTRRRAFEAKFRPRKRRSHWWKLTLSQRWMPFLSSTFSWNEFLHAGIWDVR